MIIGIDVYHDTLTKGLVGYSTSDLTSLTGNRWQDSVLHKMNITLSIVVLSRGRTLVLQSTHEVPDME